MDKKKAVLIINDHNVNGMSCRTLGKKYKVSSSTVNRLIMSNNKKQEQKALAAIPDAVMPDNMASLKEELRKARLKIALQDIMIDIANKELGIDIRKKSGTRQSK